jgi:hypothetical protein
LLKQFFFYINYEVLMNYYNEAASEHCVIAASTLGIGVYQTPGDPQELEALQPFPADQTHSLGCTNMQLCKPFQPHAN